MPKFGQVQFGNDYFGEHVFHPEWANRTYRGIVMGFNVRKQLGKEVIFRVQPGNGYYGTEKGKRYQHKYKYFVPASINNPQSQWAREKFAQAVKNWQAMTEEQKKEYRLKAQHRGGMSGYNLYIREYMKS